MTLLPEARPERRQGLCYQLSAPHPARISGHARFIVSERFLRNHHRRRDFLPSRRRATVSRRRSSAQKRVKHEGGKSRACRSRIRAADDRGTAEALREHGFVRAVNPPRWKTSRAPRFRQQRLLNVGAVADVLAMVVHQRGVGVTKRPYGRIARCLFATSKSSTPTPPPRGMAVVVQQMSRSETAGALSIQSGSRPAREHGHQRQTSAGGNPGSAAREGVTRGSWILYKSTRACALGDIRSQIPIRWSARRSDTRATQPCRRPMRKHSSSIFTTPNCLFGYSLTGRGQSIDFQQVHRMAFAGGHLWRSSRAHATTTRPLDPR